MMIGRKEEIESLREAATADRSRFIVVYGRRRVGKTFLIREAFDYRFTFSHTGMEASSMADQLESFHASLIDQGMSPCEVPRNWIQAFDCLRRANGNTLVSHLDAVSEYTPSHELVWQFKCEDAPSLKLANLCGIQELPNGNLVVGTYANGLPDASRATAFETTRDKKIVWSWASSGDRSMMTCWKLK